VITIHQRHRRTERQTDRQTTCDRNTALCTKVHRAVKTPDNVIKLRSPADISEANRAQLLTSHSRESYPSEDPASFVATHLHSPASSFHANIERHQTLSLRQTKQCGRQNEKTRSKTVRGLLRRRELGKIDANSAEKADDAIFSLQPGYNLRQRYP